MPAAIAVPAIASVIGGGLGTVASLNGQGAQERSTNAALDFEKQREAERKREYDMQQSASRQQWDAYQGQLAPYRALAMAAMSKRYHVPIESLQNLAGYAGYGGGGGAYGGSANPPVQQGLSQMNPNMHPGISQYGRTIADLGLQDEDPSRRADIAYNQNQRQP